MIMMMKIMMMITIIMNVIAIAIASVTLQAHGVALRPFVIPIIFRPRIFESKVMKSLR